MWYKGSHDTDFHGTTTAPSRTRGVPALPRNGPHRRAQPNRTTLHLPRLCHACQRTFAESKGTPLHDLKYPVWVVVLVLTLLAYGCPAAAIVAAFVLDARTVLAWQGKAGTHAEQIQAAVVCHGKLELGPVPADELCVNTQQGKVWMAPAMSVFARLFLWGEVGAHRDTSNSKCVGAS